MTVQASARQPVPPPIFDRELLFHLALFAVIALLAMLRSAGAYHDDDLDHYYMARSAFGEPRFFVDPWGRPGFTLLYALPAQLGWNAVRLTTIVIALITMVVTTLTARRLGALRPGIWGALAAWQPLFLLLSFSALTEPLAALLLALVLYAQASDRPRLATVTVGLLPLVRQELGVVAILVAGWIVLHRRDAWRELLWIPLPVLAWAIVGGLIHGDAAWLPDAILGSSRPLNSTGPLHYFRNLISVTGPVIFLGLFLGMMALAFQSTRGPSATRPPKFAALTLVVVFGLLTLLTWEKLPFGGSVGFLRHLIVLAPVAALVAGYGYQFAIDSSGRWRWSVALVTLSVTALVGLVLSHRLAVDFYVIEGRDWSRLAGLVPVALLVLVAPWLGRRRRLALSIVPLLAAGFCLATIRPIDLNVEQKVIKAAVDYMTSQRLLGRPMMANHPWIYFFTHRDRWDRQATPYVTLDNLSSASPGTLAIWENHYGQRLYGNVPVEALRNDPRWEMIYEVESGDGQFRVVMFERRGG